MATNARSRQNGTERYDPRPDYFILGIDERGSHHVADTTTETVHIIHRDGSRGRRLLDGGDMDDYMDAVEDAYGWRREVYGVGLVEQLAGALGDSPAAGREGD